MNGIRALGGVGQPPSCREKAVVDGVEPAPLSLHEPDVVEDPREMIVPPSALVEDVGRGDPDRQSTRVHHLESVRVQVEEDVAALSVGSMNERIHEELSNHDLLVRWDLSPEHAVR